MEGEIDSWNVGTRFSQVSPFDMIKIEKPDNIKPPTTVKFSYGKTTVPDPRLVKMGPPYPSSPVPYAKPCPSVEMPPPGGPVHYSPAYYQYHAPSVKNIVLIGVGVIAGWFMFI